MSWLRKYETSKPGVTIIDNSFEEERLKDFQKNQSLTFSQFNSFGNKITSESPSSQTTSNSGNWNSFAKKTSESIPTSSTPFITQPTSSFRTDTAFLQSPHGSTSTFQSVSSISNQPKENNPFSVFSQPISQPQSTFVQSFPSTQTEKSPSNQFGSFSPTFQQFFSPSVQQNPTLQSNQSISSLNPSDKSVPFGFTQPTASISSFIQPVSQSNQPSTTFQSNQPLFGEKPVIFGQSNQQFPIKPANETQISLFQSNPGTSFVTSSSPQSTPPTPQPTFQSLQSSFQSTPQSSFQAPIQNNPSTPITQSAFPTFTSQLPIQSTTTSSSFSSFSQANPIIPKESTSFSIPTSIVSNPIQSTLLPSSLMTIKENQQLSSNIPIESSASFQSSPLYPELLPLNLPLLKSSLEFDQLSTFDQMNQTKFTSLKTTAKANPINPISPLKSISKSSSSTQLSLINSKIHSQPIVMKELKILTSSDGFVNLNAPFVSKSDYILSPTEQQLELMTDEQLSRVKDFKITRIGFGSIEFQGECDLKRLDLNKILSIDHHSVEVNESCLKDLSAKITFFNYKSKKNDQQLNSTLKKHGMNFISYNRKSNELIFNVAHF